jgi:predicted dehydrogenase
MRFASGATGQLALTDASHDGQVLQSSIHGADGTIVRSPSRSGKSPLLIRDGKEISGEQLLELVSEFVLDEPTAILWGGQDRLGSYRMEFAEIDCKLIALEYEDFVSAVRTGKQPEVGWKEGMEALALAYAIVEAGELGHSVSVDDVLEGRVSAYQSVIDQSFAI